MVSTYQHQPDITLTFLLQKGLNVFTIEVITDQSQQSICETSHNSHLVSILFSKVKNLSEKSVT